MKITKNQLGLFLVMYDQLFRKLREDLMIYRDAAKQTLREHDMQCFNLDDPNDLKEIAELFFYHRIESFKERKMGEPAVEQVIKILNDARKK